MDGEKISAIVKGVLDGMAEQRMTLQLAEKLSAAVKEKARTMGVNAVVAVTNAAARPVLVECMDDSFIASFDVALKKAYTVVALKMSTIELKPLANPGGSLYGIQFTNDNSIIVFGGGDPLMKGGKIIGGLGVSGGTEEQDTALSAYGRKVFESII
ncbi:MAG: heme-binding protein [Clostridia bacterium]|nr:heme-binding protein [Clostridia bacterium]